MFAHDFYLPGLETYLEELGFLDPLKEVVAAALLLHDIAGLVGLFLLVFLSGPRGLWVAYQNADLLVGILAGDAMGGELHQNRLSSHWYKCVSIRVSREIKLPVNILNGSSWSIRDRMTFG